MPQMVQTALRNDALRPGSPSTATPGTLFAFVIVYAGVWVRRVKNPDQARPFKTPWVPVVPVLGMVVNVALMYSLGWSNWLRLVIGQAIYFAYGAPAQPPAE